MRSALSSRPIRHFYGEYLTNAQGEDVVAGIRTPHPLTVVQKHEEGQLALEEVMPKMYAELCGYRDKLERHYKDMLDLEFTVERGKLWMLQTRSGKRTGLSAVRIAADMWREGLLNEREALLRVDPETHLVQLLHPRIDPKADAAVLAKGLNASPGAASGAIVFTAEAAVRPREAGQAVVLVRTETSLEDIEGMAAARGILTARGGRTSHAAVVARGMGRVCAAGCRMEAGQYFLRYGIVVMKSYARLRQIMLKIARPSIRMEAAHAVVATMGEAS